MGKMKREWESLVERGVLLGNDMEDNVQKRYTTTKFNDPYNLWDTDDRGDNRVDFERVWESL